MAGEGLYRPYPGVRARHEADQGPYDGRQDLPSALDTLAKRGAGAFVPEVQQNVEKCPAVKKQLDAALAKIRAEYDKGIKASDGWRKSLEDKIRNAA